MLATFDGAAQALRCAAAIRQCANRDRLRIRAGVHVGEVELIGADVRGVAVHEVARIMNAAGPDEVLVSETTRTITLTCTSRAVARIEGASCFAGAGACASPPGAISAAETNNAHRRVPGCLIEVSV